MSDPVVATIQMTSADAVAPNLAAAGALLEQAHARGAQLAVLPENFALMSARESDKLAAAEADGAGPIQEFLAATARRLRLWIVGGTVPLRTREARRIAAACLVYDDGGARVARYDKMHLFDVDVPGGETHRESATFAPGAGPPVVVPTPVGRVGLSVCYDLRFPELYRALGRAGAEVLVVPSAFTERTGEAHWEVLLRARAIENQAFVVAPGQSGAHASGRRTWGHSLIVDPWGRALAQCADGPGVATAPLSLASLASLRKKFPVLEHRRL